MTRARQHVAAAASPALAQLVASITTTPNAAHQAATKLASAEAQIAQLRDALERCHYHALRGRVIGGHSVVWASPHDKAIHDTADQALLAHSRWAAGQGND